MKVPCGGFDLDESVFNVDKNSKQVKLNSPISYDYMPEGYPKKGRWSIEWDGNTEGKLYIPIEEGLGLCKISDMVLSDDDLLGAMITFPGYPERVHVIASDEIVAISDDAVSIRVEDFSTCVVRKDNASVSGITIPEKGVYTDSNTMKFKMYKENITPMSTDFLPKNLNVVFKKESVSTPANCNVTYNELRDWVERGVPVFSVFIDAADSKYIIYNIIEIALLTDKLGFVYYNDVGKSNGFAYKSDGTIEIQPGQ